MISFPFLNNLKGRGKDEKIVAFIGSNNRASRTVIFVKAVVEQI
ncbi:hypothetical protein bcere0007_29270 [Bacillus mycoides]|nr:hypothetical protein bcere0007_29270 [Bacillus mycoides]